MRSSSYYGAAHHRHMRAEEARAFADELKEGVPKAIMLGSPLIMTNLPSGSKKLNTLVGQKTGCKQVGVPF
jgi:hypothetical protein